MKYGVKHGLQGRMSLGYTLVRAEGDNAIARAEADPIAFFEDEQIARACSAALNAEWGVLAQLLDEYKISDPDPIRPLLDFARAQKLMLSKACEGAKTYGDSRMVDVCSVCHEPLYEHVKVMKVVDAGGRELGREQKAPAQHAPASSAPFHDPGKPYSLGDLLEADLRVISRTRRLSIGGLLVSRAREICEEIETFPASAMRTHVSTLASNLLKLLSDILKNENDAVPSESASTNAASPSSLDCLITCGNCGAKIDAKVRIDGDVKVMDVEPSPPTPSFVIPDPSDPKSSSIDDETGRLLYETHYGKTIGIDQRPHWFSLSADVRSDWTRTSKRFLETMRARFDDKREASSKLDEPDDWDDKPDEWTMAIEAAFPTRSNSHDEYATAMKMISTRHSKRALVALVNWLLVSLDKSGERERAAVVAYAERGGVPRSFIDAVLRGAHLSAKPACTCREIQANDPKRHFKGCALRKEVIIGDPTLPLAEHSVSAHNAMLATQGRCDVFACPCPTRELREGKIPAGAEIILSDGSTVTTKEETSFVFVTFGGIDASGAS